MMHSSSDARSRTVFTMEQKRILIQAYENGMNAINKNQAQAITDRANQLQCDESVIKVIFSIVYLHVYISL